MKEGWEYKTLGECCDILDKLRKPIKQSNRKSGSIPYYGATGLLDFVKDYLFDETLVLLGEDGAKWGAGDDSAFIISGKSWVNNHAHVLKPHSNLVDRYLVYYLKMSNLSGYITGVTVPKLNQERMRQIPIPVTTLDEQLRIVSYLDTTFANIDNLKSNASKALSEAKALFQAALAEAMMPKEGWEEKTLKEASIIYGNYGLSVPSIPYNGVRYLRITDITEWGELNNEKVSANVDVTTQDKLAEGDILFARTGATVGKTLIYKKEYGDCLFAGYLIRYRINKEILSPDFLFYITHSKKYYEWIAENQKAAAQPNISAKLYNNFIVCYPNLEQQHQIVRHLDTLSSKVRQMEENYRKTLAECDALKQAILRDVFE